MFDEQRSHASSTWLTRKFDGIFLSFWCAISKQYFMSTIALFFFFFGWIMSMTAVWSFGSPPLILSLFWKLHAPPYFACGLVWFELMDRILYVPFYTHPQQHWNQSLNSSSIFLLLVSHVNFYSFYFLFSRSHLSTIIQPKFGNYI